MEQPMQLRMPFTQPEEPVHLFLTLAGLRVLVHVRDGRDTQAMAHLSAVGLPVEQTEHGVSFPAVRLDRLRSLPDQVTVTVDDDLAPLWQLLTLPSEDGVPATIEVDPDGSLLVRWFDGVNPHSFTLSDQAAPLLLALDDIRFVATAAAWTRLESSTHSRPAVGTVRANLDGFLEITTARPQLVESAPVRALFKLDDGRFGVPLPYRAEIDTVDGLRWDGPPPALERAPAVPEQMPLTLSRHLRGDLQALCDQLAAYRAQMIAWDAGLGRRILALAAVEVLDAWPVLIVAPPSRVWVWLRHLDLLGRSLALTHQRADAHLVTYRDLAHRRDLTAPATIVLDDVCSDEASAATARAGVRRLDGLMGAYRMAITSDWPDDVSRQVELLSLLRPGEFAPDVPLVLRYPSDPDRRAAEHVAAYLSRRRADAPDVDRTPFRRSTVLVVRPSAEQQRVLDDLDVRLRPSDPARWLVEASATVSAGTASVLSPKVAAAVGRARRAAEGGRTVALLTRHRRTATLLAASLRGLPGRTVVQTDASAGTPDADLAVVRFDRTLPDLRSFDLVVAVDYPWTLTLLDDAVGAAPDTVGAGEVLLIHAAGTVDDRIALLAARRIELDGVVDRSAPPDDGELAYLAASR